MRVSKVVKDYITKAVNDAYQSRKENISKEYNKRIDSFDEEIEEILKEANEKACALLDKYNLTPSYSSRTKIITKHGSVWNEEEFEAITKLNREINAEINNKITEIILTLELGGNKADLDRMLAELK